MQSFTLGWPRSRILCGLGRNPLVRVTDRIESVVALLAIAIVILSIPVAAAIGTAERERLADGDSEYAASLVRVHATVTDPPTVTRDGLYKLRYATPVRWVFGRDEHHGTVDWERRTHTGDELTIWVDGAGELSRGPAPEGQAARDAVAVAVTSWWLVAGVAALAVWLMRWRLDAKRTQHWSRDLRRLADDGSRH